MTNIVEYKGYKAEINYSAEDNCFIGKLLNIKDVVLFEGITVTGLKIAFKNTVEDYIDLCERLGK